MRLFADLISTVTPSITASLCPKTPSISNSSCTPSTLCPASLARASTRFSIISPYRNVSLARGCKSSLISGLLTEYHSLRSHGEPRFDIRRGERVPSSFCPKRPINPFDNDWCSSSRPSLENLLSSLRSWLISLTSVLILAIKSYRNSNLKPKHIPLTQGLEWPPGCDLSPYA